MAQKRASKPAPKREPRDVPIHVRLTKTEAREWGAFADRKSTPLGTLMRQAMAEKIEREGG
jgi:hypothetical protein